MKMKPERNNETQWNGMEREKRERKNQKMSVVGPSKRERNEERKRAEEILVGSMYWTQATKGTLPAKRNKM